MRPHCIFAASILALSVMGCTPTGDDSETPGQDSGGQEGDAGDAPDVDGAADTGDGADTGEARPLTIFLSSGKLDLTTGLAAIDESCGQDTKATAGVSYKALLGSPSRLPINSTCETLQVEADWPLEANTVYAREDGVVLFTTNAASTYTDWPMDNPFSDVGTNFASGLDREWCVIPDKHCSDWASAEGEAAVGWTASDDGGFLKGGNLGCGNLYVMCVEQP